MAEETKEKKNASSSSSSSSTPSTPSKSNKSEGSSGGGSGGGPLKKLGCGCLLLIMLFASFLLGTLYGRKVFPYLFDKAHRGVDAVSEHAHDGIEKADESIKDNSE